MPVSRFLRFSLRSLIFLLLLVCSAGGLWWRWEPWVLGPVLEGHSVKGLSNDGRYVATCTDKAVHIWNADSLAEERRLPGNCSYVVFSPDNRFLIVHEPDILETKTVWNLETGERALQGLWGWMFFSKDSSQLITGCEYRRFEVGSAVEDPATTGIHIWDLSTRKKIATLGSEPHCNLPTLSRDGALLFTDDSVASEHFVRVWNLQTRTIIASLPHEFPVRSRECSADSRRLVTSEAGHVHVWDLPSGRLLKSMPLDLETIELSPDGQRLATIERSSSAHVARMRDAATLNVLYELNTSVPGVVPGISFSADSQRFVLNPEGHVCDAADGAVLWKSERPAYFLSNDDLMVSSFGVWHRRRPEWRWGVARLPEFWLALVSGLALMWSLWRDRPKAAGLSV
jgi:WD40 repeat protein